MRERIERLLVEMNKGIYEKETELSLALLAALAGESIILLGPPGVAKSMVARRLKRAFAGARSFEYLMSRFSTPDEIFGPVSISRLKSADSYERSVDGYLPTADIVFLDEIWKAGPAIQNTLLTVINEKLFRNGNRELRLPLKLLVAASNELPARGEGLEALWDRFVIRVESRPISSEELFDRMLLDGDACVSDGAVSAEDGAEASDNGSEASEDGAVASEDGAEASAPYAITAVEYAAWRKDIRRVGIGGEALSCINAIRRAIRFVTLPGDEQRDIYVSDRRWKNIAGLLRTSAFMHDRGEVTPADIVPVYHCLWQEPDERDTIRGIVIGAVLAQVRTRLNDMREALADDIRKHRAMKAAGRISRRQLARDLDKKVYNDFYYYLPDHESGNTYIVMTDYQQLPAYGSKPHNGIIYNDRRNPKCSVIRSYDGTSAAPVGSRPVSLTRNDTCVFIDGVMFAIEQLAEGDSRELPFGDANADSLRDYDGELERLVADFRALESGVAGNMFLSPADKNEIKEQVKAIYQQMAFTRQDIQKLYD